MTEFVERPWGGYRVLYEDDKYKVKELVFTGGFIRPQKHECRSEHWTVIEGKITGYLGVEPRFLQEGSTEFIAQGAWHWFGGVGRVIEVQMGDWLDESDIIVRDAP